MIGRDTDVNLRISEHPEFDAWRWHEYWVPLDVVIEFKRDVYMRALQELSRFLRPVQAGKRNSRGPGASTIIDPSIDPPINLSEPNRP